MFVDTAWRVSDLYHHAERLREEATWELWGGTMPADANTTPGGGTVLLAAGGVNPGDVVADGATRELRLVKLVDSAVNTDGTPTFFRLLHPEGSALFSAAMVASGIDAEVIVTVEDQPGATGVIRHHTFTLDLTMQF